MAAERRLTARTLRDGGFGMPTRSPRARRTPVVRGLVAGLVLLLWLTGCSYSREEPGLFAASSPSPTESSERPLPSPIESSERPPPEPTDPNLPVLAEAEWTTAEGAAVSVRFAVHAIRRVEGATVVDWSVTPLSAPGFGLGADLPSWTDLGMGRVSDGDLNLFLLDPAGGHVYRPLSHRSRRLFNRCLCTPLWRVQQNLRVGETRLLQAAFPALPASVAFVDVDLINLPPLVHLPVTPQGQVPTATAPTDLARPRENRSATAAERVFRNRWQPRQVQSIRIDRIVSSAGHTAMQWSITSLRDQGTNRPRGATDPVSLPPPQGVELLNDDPVDGPSLRTADGRVTRRVLWMTGRVVGRPAYECLCSELGLWASSLRREDGRATVASIFPPLPPGTAAVDVVLPGVGLIRDVAVETAPDAASRVGPPAPAEVQRWTYRNDDPPAGWPTYRWPTPLPAPDQLENYRSVTEDVVPRPAG